MIDGDRYRVLETLRDGTPVTVRPVRADDAARLVRAFAALERESVHSRFFTFRRELDATDVARIGTIDFVDEVMLVVTVAGDDDETVIASGRYIACDGGAGIRAAEIAFTVEEDYQRQGLARRLLAHLARIARANRIVRFEAYVLARNGPMLAVFERSGWPMTKRRDGDTVHVTLAIG